MKFKENSWDITGEIIENIIQLRRTFHKFPELGFQEIKTSELIKTLLKNYGIENVLNIGDTGIVAVIEGDIPGNTILLRADIDGLPIFEETGLSFSSENKNMHACGHDGHISILLGVARILANNQKHIKGKILLVFQPAEEIIQGARKMIESDFFKNTHIDRVLSLHIWNQIELGQIAVNPGIVFASADSFKVKIFGVGGHGALPEATKDPIVIASSIILNSQTIISRNISPNKMGVLTFGKFNGGSAPNIIPEQVILEGTIRSYDENTRNTIIERLENLINHTSESFGVKSQFEIISATPAVINDSSWAENVRSFAANVVGEGKVINAEPISVGDDMSEFMKLAPGCYILIGAKKEGVGPHHNPKFDFKEDSLGVGLKVMVEVTRSFMNF
ncbi:MAG: peptidase M20 [Chloroflexi bacterium]|nr:peptidase M20 [Chloroflexota bacterium]|tara:strand:+ start:4701 stop:5873 length:1173 start_codon:yes stop_codon:yes gene_type:complete